MIGHSVGHQEVGSHMQLLALKHHCHCIVCHRHYHCLFKAGDALRIRLLQQYSLVRRQLRGAFSRCLV